MSDLLMATYPAGTSLSSPTSRKRRWGWGGLAGREEARADGTEDKGRLSWLTLLVRAGPGQAPRATQSA